MNLKQARRALVAVAVAAGAASAQTTVVLEPSKDNSLYQDPNGGLSNGRGVSLVAGRPLFADLRRAILAFDVAGTVPAGSTITSAALRMTVTRTAPGAELVIGTLHRVNANWGEGESNDEGPGGTGALAMPGDVTWYHRFLDSEDLWTSPGGDFEAQPSATRQLGDLGAYTWASTERMAADVQGWLDAPESSFGWIVRVSEAAEGGARRFDSREALTPDTRPKLEITFTPPPPLCPADFNGDGFRNPDDLADFITCFFLDVQFPGFCPEADFNGDEFRDPDDLADFITVFFLSTC